jgi:hypothetical protein
MLTTIACGAVTGATGGSGELVEAGELGEPGLIGAGLCATETAASETRIVNAKREGKRRATAAMDPPQQH